MDKTKLDAMRRSFEVIEKRKKKLLEDENQRITELQENVKEIRSYTIENLNELIETAKTRFSENGMEVIFAENSHVALNEIYKVIKDESTVAKSKSNNVNEIGLSAFLKNKGIELVETDLGDRIVQMDPESHGPSHPIGPAAHLNMQKIAKIASQKFKMDVKPEPKSILNVFKADILEKLSNCNVGITGANSAAAEDGALVMVHNEGNISLVSMKDTHIVVVGIDKLVRTVEDAVSVVKLETIFATGKKIPAYINVITSPSKTADIEQVLLKDMYGAKRVVVILLDNGRSKALKKSKECLLCIGCGSCIISCPVYNVTGSDFGYRGYLGGRGIVLSHFIQDNKTCFDSGLFKCTLCGLCTLECPVNINTNEMIEKLREGSVKSGICPEQHHGTTRKIKKQGSPF